MYIIVLGQMSIIQSLYFIALLDYNIKSLYFDILYNINLNIVLKY